MAKLEHREGSNKTTAITNRTINESHPMNDQKKRKAT